MWRFEIGDMILIKSEEEIKNSKDYEEFPYFTDAMRYLCGNSYRVETVERTYSRKDKSKEIVCIVIRTNMEEHPFKTIWYLAEDWIAPTWRELLPRRI